MTARGARVIHELNATAFGTDAEAKLVDALRAAGALTLSLVAETDGKIVGHIAFSPVVVSSAQRTSHGVGLAPMAFASAHQLHILNEVGGGRRTGPEAHGLRLDAHDAVERERAPVIFRRVPRDEIPKGQERLMASEGRGANVGRRPQIPAAAPHGVPREARPFPGRSALFNCERSSLIMSISGRSMGDRGASDRHIATSQRSTPRSLSGLQTADPSW